MECLLLATVFSAFSAVCVVSLVDLFGAKASVAVLTLGVVITG
jgi:hypothetical protein